MGLWCPEVIPSQTRKGTLDHRMMMNSWEQKIIRFSIPVLQTGPLHCVWSVKGKKKIDVTMRLLVIHVGHTLSKSELSLKDVIYYLLRYGLWNTSLKYQETKFERLYENISITNNQEDLGSQNGYAVMGKKDMKISYIWSSGKSSVLCLACKRGKNRWMLA
jgi:hypothetical protein